MASSTRSRSDADADRGCASSQAQWLRTSSACFSSKGLYQGTSVLISIATALASAEAILSLVFHLMSRLR